MVQLIIEDITNTNRRNNTYMNCRLTTQEKLQDLRLERKLTYAQLEKITKVSSSVLQRLEKGEDERVGYQDVRILAEFYGVSTDYLFGLTDNRNPPNMQVRELWLTDDALKVLYKKKLNTRLLSELITHKYFLLLLIAVEIYLDRTLSPHMKSWNDVFELAEQKIHENYEVKGVDKTLQILKESAVNEDEFLLEKVVWRFRRLLVDLYEEHKKNAPSVEKTDVIKTLTDDVDEVLKSESKGRAKLALLAKQLGLNMSGLTDEEIKVLIKALEKSEKFRNSRGRRK